MDVFKSLSVLNIQAPGIHRTIVVEEQVLTSFNTVFTHHLTPCALVAFSGTDFVSTSGLPAGARGL